VGVPGTANRPAEARDKPRVGGFTSFRVDKIRDLEPADIAMKAAQTGHMVMSTLHTNDAPTTLTRLANMGVAAFNIAASVLLITAQRLARKLCENCKAPADYPREAMLKAGFKPEDLDGNWKPFRAVGCSMCNNGYKGRVGIYQVMPITEEIQKIILASGSSMDIAEQAQREGVRDLRQSGLLKVRSGMTTLEELISVTNEPPGATSLPVTAFASPLSPASIR